MANPITNTVVTIGSSSTAVIEAGDSKGIFMYLCNDSDEVMYLAISGDQSVTPTAVMNEGLRLAVGATLKLEKFTGLISAICSSGSKKMTLCYY